MSLAIRKLHRLAGTILILPMLGWIVTGLVFFIKPGYSDAYDTLVPKTYELDQHVSFTPLSGWKEFRYVTTILGDHIIARTNDGWRHFDPVTLQERSFPSKDDLYRLLTDAFASNPERYGNISSIAGDTVFTDTGVEIIIDWSRLSFQQRGPDTDRIDFLYRIHYLQWTNNKSLDRVLGLMGLALLGILTLLGIRLVIKSS